MDKLVHTCAVGCLALTALAFPIKLSLPAPCPLTTFPGRPVWTKLSIFAVGTLSVPGDQSSCTPFEPHISRRPAGSSASATDVATVVAVPAEAPSGTHPPAPGPELLGANHEQGYSSDEEHERRCEQENGRRKCVRCKYKRLAAKWKEATGHSGPEGKWGWIAQRPRSWGGKWAVRCAFCHRYFAKGGQGSHCPYAKFEVRNQHSFQVRNIREHAKSATHLKAVADWESSGRDGESLRLEGACESMEEDDHFGPGMPTVDEWLGAHASCLSRTSDRGAGEHMQTDRFKAGGEWRGDSHKDMPKLRFCLAEARREEDREFLKAEDLDSSESKSR